MNKPGGYDNIHRDLMHELAEVDLAAAAEALDLSINPAGQVEILFMGVKYLLDNDGIRREDDRDYRNTHESILAGYVIRHSLGEASGRFVSFDSITGMVPAQGSYTNTALEARLVKYAEDDPDRFHDAIIQSGGLPGGETGSGGTSWIVRLLPKISIQLIFYAGDEEFPSNIRLLIEDSATTFLEFEFLAVLTSIFIEEVIKRFPASIT